MLYKELKGKNMIKYIHGSKVFPHCCGQFSFYEKSDPPFPHLFFLLNIKNNKPKASFRI
jgi:hypothetical protein